MPRISFIRLRRGPRSLPGAPAPVAPRSSAASRLAPSVERHQCPADLRSKMARVAGEDLIAPHAAEDYGQVLARRRADEVRGDACRVGDRLVHMPDELGQQVDDVRLRVSSW